MRAALAFTGHLLLAAAAAAEGGDRLTLTLSGLMSPLSPEFDEARNFTLFAEQGDIANTYSPSPRPGLQLGVEYRLSARLGLVASAALSSGDAKAKYTSRVPHPLYLDKHRTADGSVDDLTYADVAAHLGLSYRGKAGAIGYRLFAGPSLYRMKPQLITNPQTRETYPYDDVVLQFQTLSASKASPGFHAGAGLDYALGPKLAVGLDARYGRASGDLQVTDNGKTRVLGGGVQLALGLRLGI